MKMNKHHALRFLLLKHLWKLRVHVPVDRHRAIAESLDIEKTADTWVVQWTDGGERKTFEFPLDDIALYIRGDLGGSRTPPGNDVKNEVLGERFARQALGIAGDLGRQAKVSRFERLEAQLFGCAVVMAAMMATASLPTLEAVALVAGMALTEFWFRKGKAVNAVLGLALAVVGAPVAALLANSGLAILNFADPDRKWRAYRIAAHLAAAAVAFAAFLRHPAPVAPVAFIAAALVAAILVTYFRWLNGSHFRLYPLVFPLICAGLVWDGEWLAGAVGLLGAVAGFAAPRLLAPNVTTKGTHPALVKRLGSFGANPPVA